MGDDKRAHRLAEQAVLDARLAYTLARAARAERAIDAIRLGGDPVAHRATATQLSRNP